MNRELGCDQKSSILSDNHALDSDANPAVGYRGERGEPNEAPFQTRYASITFVNAPEAASPYAMQPNDHWKTPKAPRVFRATLDIRNPVVNQPGDPFIDGTQFAAAVRDEMARSILSRHAATIESTDNWQHLGATFTDAHQFLNERPEQFAELYLEAYHLLDDGMTVKAFRKAGYGGAIYQAQT